MFDFTSTNAKRKSPESSVSGRMRVTADNGGSRPGKALLGPDDMYDTLPPIAHPKIGEAKRLDVLLQSKTLES